MSYVNDIENGLLVSKQYGDVVYNLKYIPSDYFFLKDNNLSNLDEKSIYRLKMDYENSLYMIMNIKPINPRDRIIDRNTNSIIEFKRKSLELNFGIKELIHLQNGDEKLYPVLATNMDVYELNGSKSILIAFSLDGKQLDDVELVFDDVIFTGTKIKFNYSKEAIKGIPKFRL